MTGQRDYSSPFFLQDPYALEASKIMAGSHVREERILSPSSLVVSTKFIIKPSVFWIFFFLQDI